MEEQDGKFKKWYGKNKDRVSAARKERYHEDPTYRAKKKADANRYYWLQSRRANSVTANQAHFAELAVEPAESIEIIVEDRRDLRCGMTLVVPVYYPNQVADVLRRSVQTVRLWMLKGLLPDVFKRNARNYRVFTEDQFRVLVESRHWLAFNAKDFAQHPFFALVAERLEELEPTGIALMAKSDWRIDPAMCPFCGAPESLQHKINGKWTHVSCFACMNPADVHNRQVMKRFHVSATCTYCNGSVSQEMVAVQRSKLRVQCPTCGRLIPKIAANEINRIESEEK